MENAAQALLIAGGILLAILTLSLLVYTFGNASTIFNAQDKENETARLAKWNAEWEAYNKQLLYGTEVLTVVNKAEQNNSEYEYKVTVTIISKPDDKTIEEYLSGLKTNIFKCDSMTYNEKTGRVEEIKFSFVR